jgi:putative PIN family toxin of toxin-antitoxin system
MTDIIPKRVVIDTNVCLDLFVFNDPRWKNILTGLQSGSIQAITRKECRDEWLAVLKYPHLPVTPDNIEHICKQFEELIQCTELHSKEALLLPRCSDKDDQKFLETARDSEAQYLITKDKALLKLAKRIRKLGLFSIETPEQFLHSIHNTH